MRSGFADGGLRRVPLERRESGDCSVPIRHSCCLVRLSAGQQAVPPFRLSSLLAQLLTTMVSSLSHLVSSACMICSPSYVFHCMCQAMVCSMHTCYSVAEIRDRLSCGRKARANGLHMEKRRKSGKYLENDGTSGFSSNGCHVPLRLSRTGRRPIPRRKSVAVQQNTILRSLFM